MKIAETLCISGFVTILVISINTVTGCKCEDARSLTTVVPGRGIVNQLEIGMSLKEIANRRPDFVITTKRARPGAEPFGFSGSIPNMGIYLNVTKQDAPVGTIDFLVDPESTSNRFYGKLDGVSFERGTPVKRLEVVKKFGNLRSYGATETEIAREALLAGQNVAVSGDDGSEMLYYMSKGVMFDIRGGIVVRFAIMAACTNNIGTNRFTVPLK